MDKNKYLQTIINMCFDMEKDEQLNYHDMVKLVIELVSYLMNWMYRIHTGNNKAWLDIRLPE